MVFYLPTLRGRNKWREAAKNLQVDELFLVGDAENISDGGSTVLVELRKSFLKCTVESHCS